MLDLRGTAPTFKHFHFKHDEPINGKSHTLVEYKAQIVANRATSGRLVPSVKKIIGYNKTQVLTCVNEHIKRGGSCHISAVPAVFAANGGRYRPPEPFTMGCGFPEEIDDDEEFGTVIKADDD